MPRYLLLASGYMLLENKTNLFEETDLTNSYHFHRDVSCMWDGNSTILDLFDMNIDKNICDIYEIIVT